MSAGRDPCEHLTEMLGARFHQAWSDEHESAEACLEAMLAAEPPERRHAAAAEIERLLGGPLCESQIRDVLLYEVGCHYALEAEGLEASGWLRRVRERLLASDHPSSGPAHVFAYGSNLDPARMTGRVASARAVGRARLQAFELRFHKRGSRDGTGKANAHPSGTPHAEVHGVVYEIDAVELEALDAHEGGYERQLLTVEVEGDGRRIEAWVYLARPDTIDDALSPEPWYLDHVLTGARSHGLPAALVETLQALRASLPSR